LRAQEEGMKKRDAEINRLLGELRRCQTQLLGLQVQKDIIINITIRESQLYFITMYKKGTNCKPGELGLDNIQHQLS
jgi:adenylyl- and sulfurtransferase ThiI